MAARKRRTWEPATDHRCPLCGTGTEPFHAQWRREYRRCPQCALICVPPGLHLDATREKAQYERHDNDPADPRYRQFLSRTADAVMARVDPPARGLDFGSGPGPTLSVMLEEAGYSLTLYDKFYAPDPSAFDRSYDFVTSTETFEHLDAPAATLEQLLACLRPGGWLIVMTKRPGDQAMFARWHYTADPTHISFFSEATFRWIADHWHLHLEIVSRDVVALRTVSGEG